MSLDHVPKPPSGHVVTIASDASVSDALKILGDNKMYAYGIIITLH
jgi:hypothetical protein